MFLTTFFQKAHIGLAFLPIMIILHFGQLAPVDGTEVNCLPHFDSEYGNPTACKNS
ncbi:hypothetical protein PGT21_019452 [Puccinia graminis f. sp. tritici]|uniref:Uncharacterized protein n=1 Tax=Puccinia graminis f. sp. tritici TaxID=56615 RepID=A0A5B0S1I0_PUCGR|nr:hypothetical protein PGT21_019452 [Puccinia graminis f. sp. tritici]KAA1131900.1 hypothetical protein PGTUg99_033222 [Puccinia graminis f. sp. tritici]